MAKVWSHSAMAVASSGFHSAYPALLTRMSTGPSSARVRARRLASELSLVRSVTTATRSVNVMVGLLGLGCSAGRLGERLGGGGSELVGDPGVVAGLDHMRV